MAEMDPRQRAFYQGLLGLGAGILANNAPSRFPGGGTQALGKGLQQGLQTFNQALTMEEKMDALREERALKGELEERIPDLIAQARTMGVDEGILRSAELMASVKPSSVVATLNNAMVKAQKDPGNQVEYLEPTLEDSAQTPGLFRIERKKDGSLRYLDKNLQPLKSFDAQKTEKIPASSIASPSYVGEMGSSSPVYDQAGDILGYNIVTEPGKTKFIEAKKEGQTKSKTKAEDMGPFPEIGHQVELPGTDSVLVHKGGNAFQEVKKAKTENLDMKPEKLSPGVIGSADYVGEPGSTQPVYADGEVIGYNIVTDYGKTEFKTLDQLKKDGTGSDKTKDVKPGDMGPFQEIGATKKIEGSSDMLVHMGDGNWQRTPKEKAKEVKDESQFNYYTKSSLPAQFESFSGNIGEGDVLKVKDGEASVVRKPVAKDDPDNLDFRTKIVKGEDGKLYEQTGYFDKKSGKMVHDHGKLPVKVEGALTQKQKIDLVNETLKKPNQRIDSMVVQFDSIATAVGAGESFDDLALIFYIAKMLDPTSVVREGEQLTIKNTGSMGDKMIAWINQINSGAPFSKKQRNAIINFAERKINTELNNYQRAVTKARSQAGKLKIDQDTQDGALGIVHENYDTKTIADGVRTAISLLPDVGGGNNKKTNNPIKKNTPQASAGEKLVEKIRSAVTSESPPGNIENDEELESILK